MTITTKDICKGQTHFTTRGIAEIKDFFPENDTQKVRLRLHIVDRSDGVTPTGESILMSTTPENLCCWINAFEKDLKERRTSVSTLKNHKPHLAGQLDDILSRIDAAIADGPSLNTDNGVK